MNRATLTVGLALMDTCWVFPWAVLLQLWIEPARGGGLLSAVSILALVLLGALTTQWLGRHARGGRGRRLALAGLAVLAASAAVRFDQYPTAGGLEWVAPFLGALAAVIGQLSATAFAFALALYLWWRGVRVGSQTPGFSDVESAFRWGIGRLAAFALVMAISTRPSLLPAVEAGTTPYVVGYFFVSLLTLALGRLESLRTRTRGPTLNTQWLAVLIVVAGIVVLLALLLGQLLSFDVLIVATRPLFDVLGIVLLVLLYLLVIPLSYVVQWIVYLVLALLQPDPNRQPPRPPQPADIDNALQRFLSQQIPPELLVALKTLGAAMLVGLALLIVARSLARWRPSSSDADATNEVRDSLWNTARLRALLLAWLRRWLRRGAGDIPATPGAAVNTRATTEVTRLSSVRQLYAQLLRIGESFGSPRGAATTPLEHLPALSRALEPDEPLTALTAAYVQVRYADSDVSEEEADALRHAMDRLQPKGAGD